MRLYHFLLTGPCPLAACLWSPFESLTVIHFPLEVIGCQTNIIMIWILIAFLNIPNIYLGYFNSFLAKLKSHLITKHLTESSWLLVLYELASLGESPAFLIVGILLEKISIFKFLHFRTGNGSASGHGLAEYILNHISFLRFFGLTISLLPHNPDALPLNWAFNVFLDTILIRSFNFFRRFQLYFNSQWVILFWAKTGTRLEEGIPLGIIFLLVYHIINLVWECSIQSILYLDQGESSIVCFMWLLGCWIFSLAVFHH